METPRVGRGEGNCRYCPRGRVGKQGPTTGPRAKAQGRAAVERSPAARGGMTTAVYPPGLPGGGPAGASVHSGRQGKGGRGDVLPLLRRGGGPPRPGPRPPGGGGT